MKHKMFFKPIFVLSLMVVMLSTLALTPAVLAADDSLVSFFDDFSSYIAGTLGQPIWANYLKSGAYNSQSADIAENPVSGGKGLRLYLDCVNSVCSQSVDLEKYRMFEDFSLSVKTMKTLDTRDPACGQPSIIVPIANEDSVFRIKMAWGYYPEGIFYCDSSSTPYGSCQQLAGAGIGTPGRSLNTWYSMDISFAGQVITATYDKGTANEHQYTATHATANSPFKSITLQQETCGYKQQEVYFDDISLTIPDDSSKTFLMASPVSSVFYQGDAISLALPIHNPNGTSAVEANCKVNPAILRPQGMESGDYFDQVNHLVGANQVDANAGTSLLAVAQRNPADTPTSDGQFATINYLALNAGTATVTCTPLFSDRNGFPLPGSYIGTAITVIPFGVVNGISIYQGRLSQANITLTATGPVVLAAVTEGNGNFTFDHLEAGNYEIKADATSYLPNCTEATINSGQTVALPSTTLKGGDVNDDDAINIGDATLMASYYGLHPNGADRLDINADGVVNIQDLSILAGSFGLSGCQDW